MRTFWFCSLSFVAGFVFFISSVGAERAVAKNTSVNAEMRQVYDAYKELQFFIYDINEFESSKNDKFISDRLNKIAKGFHNIESFEQDYQEQPGFNSYLLAVKGALADVSESFAQGNKEWANNRIRALNNHCMSCHVSYGTGVKFHDENNEPKIQNLEAKGDYYFATRQFDRAIESYLAAIKKAKTPLDRINPLRRWLTIQIRTGLTPEKIIANLSRLKRDLKLYPFELEEIASWMDSLHAWRGESASSQSRFEVANKLLKKGLSTNDPLYANIGTIELLRAGSLLHDSLNKDKLTPDQRRDALYMLGFTYAKLPGYFTDEAPEIFLEKCIRDYPVSKESQSAYRLLRELIAFEYTGSGGEHLPASLWAKLKELEDLAYGNFNGAA